MESQTNDYELLNGLNGVTDLRAMDPKILPRLAEEIDRKSVV